MKLKPLVPLILLSDFEFCRFFSYQSMKHYGIRLILFAFSMACVLRFTSIFSKSFEVCVFIVLRETNKRSAISRLLNPSAINCRTSSSRLLSPSLATSSSFKINPLLLLM